MLLGGKPRTKPTAQRPTDPADVIALFALGSGTALADAIRDGHGPRVKAYPQRPLQPPTPRDEMVGSLLAGFRDLKHGKHR